MREDRVGREMRECEVWPPPEIRLLEARQPGELRQLEVRVPLERRDARRRGSREQSRLAEQRLVEVDVPVESRARGSTVPSNVTPLAFTLLMNVQPRHTNDPVTVPLRLRAVVTVAPLSATGPAARHCASPRPVMEMRSAAWQGELAACAPETQSAAGNAATIRIIRPTETNVLLSSNAKLALYLRVRYVKASGMCRKGLVAGAFRRQNSCLNAEISRSPSGLP